MSAQPFERSLSYRRSDYRYALPRQLIATRPSPARTRCRLLVLDRSSGVVAHSSFDRLADHLRADDLLVLNDTKVIPARLFGCRRGSRGRIELLLVKRLDATAREAAGARRQSPPAAADAWQVWEAMVRPGKRLRPGVELLLEDDALIGEVLRIEPSGRRIVRLRSADGVTPIADLLERVGHMPIPPYLGRRDDARDRADYQTVFARVPGAVAAPTAGLHFTLELLQELQARGIANARLTLHVGPGTFQPVEVDDVRAHRMESEWFELPAATARTIERTRERGGRIVAVGTTVARTLEARARAAAPGDGLAAGSGTTDLFIYPPFDFRIVDALITNFHLPESTLLMLVAAFAGRERILAAYQEAIDRGYLVYSYGDAMLIA